MMVSECSTARRGTRPVIDRSVPIPDRAVTGAGLPHRSPNAGSVLYPPGATLGPRVQMDYELVVVHSGAIHVSVDGAGREIPAGHVGLMLPGAVELYAFARDRETRHSWVALGPRRLDEQMCQALDKVIACIP